MRKCYLDNLAWDVGIPLEEDRNVITQQQQHVGRDLRHRLVVELKYTPNVGICSGALTTALPLLSLSLDLSLSLVSGDIPPNGVLRHYPQ